MGRREITMRRRSVIEVSGLMAVLGVATALLSACSSGVSQADYDAVRDQLSAKEQEAATAKQQVASLQQQVKPPEAREPKRLEAKITIVMDEGPDKMFFATGDGVQGGPFKVPAGKTVGIRVVNRSATEEHEILFGRKVKNVDGKFEDYEVNLFEKIAADIFSYPSGKKVEVGGGQFGEIELEPGGEVWIRATFPAELKGEWEIGCFVQEPDKKGHYEQGMKAAFIVE